MMSRFIPNPTTSIASQHIRPTFPGRSWNCDGYPPGIADGGEKSESIVLSDETRSCPYDAAAEEFVAAYKRAHGELSICFAAQTASLSRNILELCRMSTGKW